MITGPEATIVTRAGGAVVRGVRERMGATTDWPSLHAGLMELVAVLAEWMNAATVTQKLIEGKPAGEELPQKRPVLRVFGPMTVNLAASNADRPMFRELRGEVREQLSPKVSLVKHLTPGQRRAAGRRTLRNVMSVYCPELLSEFEEAVKRRGEWVENNHATLKAAFDSDSPDEDQLRAWRPEAQTTRQALRDAQSQLTTFIRHTFPADTRSPWA